MAETDAMRILSGEEGSPAGTTAAGIIKLSQANTTCSKGVENGGANFATKASQVTEAEVVRKNVEDIRLFGRNRKS